MKKADDAPEKCTVQGGQIIRLHHYVGRDLFTFKTDTSPVVVDAKMVVSVACKIRLKLNEGGGGG